MKKEYITAEMEVIFLDKMPDIVTASDDSFDSQTENPTEEGWDPA